MQKTIKRKNANGLLVHFIFFYVDEVAAGMNGRAHLTSIMFTLGFYADV